MTDGELNREIREAPPRPKETSTRLSLSEDPKSSKKERELSAVAPSTYSELSEVSGE